MSEWIAIRDSGRLAVDVGGLSSMFLTVLSTRAEARRMPWYLLAVLVADYPFYPPHSSNLTGIFPSAMAMPRRSRR